MRYLRTLLRFWSASIAAEMEYRANFLLEVVSTAANLIGSIFLLGLFYRHGASLGGWSWEGALVVLGIYTILEGVTATLLSPNLSRIVTQVQEGTLDFVLLKPVDSQFWLSLRTFSPWGLPSLVLGAGIVVHGALAAGAAPGWSALALVPISVGSSLIVLYSLWFVMATTSIWFVKVWNATHVLDSILVAGRYPVSAYTAGVRFVFTFLVPIAFMTTVPAEAILGRAEMGWLVAAVGVALLLFVGSRAFWRFALRFYTSASS